MSLKSFTTKIGCHITYYRIKISVFLFKHFMKTSITCVTFVKINSLYLLHLKFLLMICTSSMSTETILVLFYYFIRFLYLRAYYDQLPGADPRSIILSPNTLYFYCIYSNLNAALDR